MLSNIECICDIQLSLQSTLGNYHSRPNPVCLKRYASLQFQLYVVAVAAGRHACKSHIGTKAQSAETTPGGSVLQPSDGDLEVCFLQHNMRVGCPSVRYG